MKVCQGRSLKLVGCTFAVLILAACGGSSGDSSPEVSTQSETASTPIADTPVTDTPVDAPIMDNPPVFDGFEASINDLYTPAQVDAIEQIGLVFNLGDQPPNIEGTFRVEPVIVQATTAPEDDGETGFELPAQTYTFSNQNNSTLTVDLLLIEDSGQTTVGNGSFISGNDQQFTVYFVSETNIDGFVADTTITLSAVISGNGIENVQAAGFLLNDRGDPGDVFIPNNAGRLVIDEDGFSERIQSKDKIGNVSEATSGKSLLGTSR